MIANNKKIEDKFITLAFGVEKKRISIKEYLQNSNFQTVREAMQRISNYFDNEVKF